MNDVPPINGGVMLHVKSGLAAGVAAAAAVVLAVGPAAAAGGWTVVPAPPAGQNATLSSVSSVSDSDGWAVGETGGREPVADHWGGKSWKQTAVPTSSIRPFASLNAVSAASATDAWAVGFAYPRTHYADPVAYHWDGTAWSAQMVTNSDGSLFTGNLGVADLGPGNAWAVGRGLEHWDGTGWTEQAFPDPEHPGTLITNPGADFGQLDAISAVAADDIWIAGHYNDPTVCNGQCTGPQQTSSLHWDGVSWQEAAMPENTDSNVQYRLDSVDAISPSDVWAVGYINDLKSGKSSPLIEHWDGTSWSVVPAPPGAPDRLTGVTGSSPGSLWAVGGSATLSWDGASWAIVAGADPDSSSQLNGVSVTPGTARTWAVGYTFASGLDNPFVLENG
jgi:hypothetical protein